MHKSIGLYELGGSVDSISWTELRRALDERWPFIILRGVLSAAQIDELVGIAQGFLDTYEDAPRRNAWGMPDACRLEDSDLDASIFRKKRIRMAHFFEWNDRYARLHSLLEHATAVRNALAGFPPQKKRQIYVPIQFLHYPPGGGWLDRHQDDYVKTKEVLPDEETDQHVITISCTEKGVNFREGGLYGEVDGDIVDLEAEVKKGDLIVFNNTVWHGVAPVDPKLAPGKRLDSGKTTILITPFPKSKITGWPRS